MNDRSIVVSLFVFTFIILIAVSLFAHCTAEEECYRDAEHRPCIYGTVTYDFNDWECECLTHHGELEWRVGQGCDLD